MKAVNLIPSEQRRATPSGANAGGAYVVLGVLGVLLVMAVAYVLISNGVNDKTSKAAAAKQEADALEARTADLNSFVDFSAIKEQRLASVVTTANSRFDWERLMRELSRVMPAGSWLQSASASVAGDPEASSGAPSVPPGGEALAPTSPSATLVGCTPKQSEVAKILVRLRAMHRVSDVELNESVVEDSVKDVTVDSCGPNYKFDATVTFEPVVVEEAPRGAKSVPASLGGGS